MGVACNIVRITGFIGYTFLGGDLMSVKHKCNDNNDECAKKACAQRCSLKL